MELSTASRCIGLYEMKIAANFAHCSRDKSFLSNLVTSKRKQAGRKTCKPDPPAASKDYPETPFLVGRVGHKTSCKPDPPTSKHDPETTPILQEHDDDDVEESMPKLCDNVIGCTILVSSTVDTNVEVAGAVDDVLFATGTPIKKDDKVVTKDDPTSSMEGPSAHADHRGLFCSWEEQEKSIIVRRRQSMVCESQDVTRLKQRLHTLQQQQEPKQHQHQHKINHLAESSTTTAANWCETCSI
jgi:hypothetical protein